MSADSKESREYLQGYGGALADFNRLFDEPVRVYEALQQAGLDYHTLHDAGMEAADLGVIARCRDAWKKRPAAAYGTSPFMEHLPAVREYNAKVSRET